MREENLSAHSDGYDISIDESMNGSMDEESRSFSPLGGQLKKQKIWADPTGPQTINKILIYTPFQLRQKIESLPHRGFLSRPPCPTEPQPPHRMISASSDHLHLDLWFEPPDDPYDPQSPYLNKKVSLSSSKGYSRPVHSLSNLLPKHQVKPKTTMAQRTPKLFLSPFQQLQINHHPIDKYLPVRSSKHSISVYQRFPKRESPIKNGNAFKFFLNSASANRQYTESIAPLEQIHIKLSQITLRNDARPPTPKTPSKTEHLSELLLKNREQKKRPVSSWTRPTYKKKERCQTGSSIEPWQTTEQKFLTLW